MADRDRDARDARAFTVTALVLIAAAAFVLWPFAPWVLFAVWACALARPLHARIAARLGHRPRLAALVTTLGLLLVAVPPIVLLASLAGDAYALVRRAAATDRVRDLVSAVAPQGTPVRSNLVGLFAREGARAWDLARALVGGAARIGIDLVIAIAGTYALLVDGARWDRWLEDHAPISRSAYRRLAGAVVETGRGLVFGIVGAGLAQAAVATVLYVALGVPQAFALGVLTLACSVVPAVGSSLAWVAVAIGLYVTGRAQAAIILAIGGLLLISTIDNIARPMLARRGRLQLPAVVVALAMFGGIAALGPRGLVLGPLIIRLAKEALAIWHDEASHASYRRFLRAGSIVTSPDTRVRHARRIFVR